MAFGLVLAGGGVRGAYHVGVWKALKEMNIEVCAISGSSIGAINGALFAQGDLETALKLWEQIALDDIVSLPPELAKESDLFEWKNVLKIFQKVSQGSGLDMNPLEELLKKILDEDAVRRSKVDFGMTTYSLTEKKLITLYKNEIPKGQLIPYLMAAACLPGFKAREIGNQKLIDAGMANNMPVDMLLNRGIDDIITVNVKGIGFYRDFNTSGRNMIPIECRCPCTGTMDFNQEKIRRSITEGYLDCKREFGVLFGRECYFNASEYRAIHMHYGQEIIDGVQWAAKALGLELFREVAFDDLVKELLAAYLIQRELSEKSGISEIDKIEKLSRLDDKSVICSLVEILDTNGFDFVKSKLDLLGRNYGAASALLYFRRKMTAAADMH